MAGTDTDTQTQTQGVVRAPAAHVPGASQQPLQSMSVQLPQTTTSTTGAMTTLTSTTTPTAATGTTGIAQVGAGAGVAWTMGTHPRVHTYHGCVDITSATPPLPSSLANTNTNGISATGVTGVTGNTNTNTNTTDINQINTQNNNGTVHNATLTGTLRQPQPHSPSQTRALATTLLLSGQNQAPLLGGDHFQRHSVPLHRASMGCITTSNTTLTTNNSNRRSRHAHHRSLSKGSTATSTNTNTNITTTFANTSFPNLHLLGAGNGVLTGHHGHSHSVSGIMTSGTGTTATQSRLSANDVPHHAASANVRMQPHPQVGGGHAHRRSVDSLTSVVSVSPERRFAPGVDYYQQPITLENHSGVNNHTRTQMYLRDTAYTLDTTRDRSRNSVVDIDLTGFSSSQDYYTPYGNETNLARSMGHADAASYNQSRMSVSSANSFTLGGSTVSVSTDDNDVSNNSGVNMSRTSTSATSVTDNIVYNSQSSSNNNNNNNHRNSMTSYHAGSASYMSDGSNVGPAEIDFTLHNNSKASCNNSTYNRHESMPNILYHHNPEQLTPPKRSEQSYSPPVKDNHPVTNLYKNVLDSVQHQQREIPSFNVSPSSDSSAFSSKHSATASSVHSMSFDDDDSTMADSMSTVPTPTPIPSPGPLELDYRTPVHGTVAHNRSPMSSPTTGSMSLTTLTHRSFKLLQNWTNKTIQRKEEIQLDNGGRYEQDLDAFIVRREERRMSGIIDNDIITSKKDDITISNTKREETNAILANIKMVFKLIKFVITVTYIIVCLPLILLATGFDFLGYVVLSVLNPFVEQVYDFIGVTQAFSIVLPKVKSGKNNEIKVLPSMSTFFNRKDTTATLSASSTASPTLSPFTTSLRERKPSHSHDASRMDDFIVGSTVVANSTMAPSIPEDIVSDDGSNVGVVGEPSSAADSELSRSRTSTEDYESQMLALSHSQWRNPHDRQRGVNSLVSTISGRNGTAAVVPQSTVGVSADLNDLVMDSLDQRNRYSGQFSGPLGFPGVNIVEKSKKSKRRQKSKNRKSQKQIFGQASELEEQSSLVESKRNLRGDGKGVYDEDDYDNFSKIHSHDMQNHSTLSYLASLFSYYFGTPDAPYILKFGEPSFEETINYSKVIKDASKFADPRTAIRRELRRSIKFKFGSPKAAQVSVGILTSLMFAWISCIMFLSISLSLPMVVDEKGRLVTSVRPILQYDESKINSNVTNFEYLGVYGEALHAHELIKHSARRPSMFVAKPHEHSGETSKSIPENPEHLDKLDTYEAPISIGDETNVFLSPQVPVDTIIPRNIFQTSKIRPEGVPDFAKKNRNYFYNLFDDEQAEAYVKENMPKKVYDAYVNMKVPVLKADLFRYIVLYVSGGVYSDTDTKCVVPFDEWIHDDTSDFIVGMELDQMDHAWWKKKSLVRRLQFLQWTIISKPKHPILANVIDKITEMTPRIAPLLQLADKDTRTAAILDYTGPGIFTDAIMSHISGKQISDPSRYYEIHSDFVLPKWEFDRQLEILEFATLIEDSLNVIDMDTLGTQGQRIRADNLLFKICQSASLNLGAKKLLNPFFYEYCASMDGTNIGNKILSSEHLRSNLADGFSDIADLVNAHQVNNKPHKSVLESMKSSNEKAFSTDESMKVTESISESTTETETPTGNGAVRFIKEITSSIRTDMFNMFTYMTDIIHRHPVVWRVVSNVRRHEADDQSDEELPTADSNKKFKSKSHNPHHSTHTHAGKLDEITLNKQVDMLTSEESKKYGYLPREIYDKSFAHFAIKKAREAMISSVSTESTTGGSHGSPEDYRKTTLTNEDTTTNGAGINKRKIKPSTKLDINSRKNSEVKNMNFDLDARLSIFGSSKCFTIPTMLVPSVQEIVKVAIGQASKAKREFESQDKEYKMMSSEDSNEEIESTNEQQDFFDNMTEEEIEIIAAKILSSWCTPTIKEFREFVDSANLSLKEYKEASLVLSGFMPTERTQHGNKLKAALHSDDKQTNAEGSTEPEGINERTKSGSKEHIIEHVERLNEFIKSNVKELLDRNLILDSQVDADVLLSLHRTATSEILVNNVRILPELYFNPSTHSLRYQLHDNKFAKIYHSFAGAWKV